MKKVVVIGGGLSGLSASVSLAEKNIPVLLLEASERLGGRVSSFYDPAFDSEIDNGQHIMMGCYRETLKYLERINARNNFYFQKDLRIVFYNEGKSYELAAQKGLYPFNLLNGLISFRLLVIKDRLDLVRFFLTLPLASKRDLEKITASEWLIEKGQSDTLKNIFWNVFIIGAMNTIPEKASALLLRNILIEIFFTGRRSSAVVIPDKPLTRAFADPAADYLRAKGSEISLSERVIRINKDRHKNRIAEVVTNKRVVTDFDYIISAVPLYALKKFVNIRSFNFNPFYSSILSVHFKYREELLTERFAAVVDSHIHWVFKQKDHYTIVISSADNLVYMSNDEITDLIIEELKRNFNIRAELISCIKVIKEKRATFVPSPDILFSRPGNRTPLDNFFIAGDWTDTGLPATIEGAVVSGHKAAQEIINIHRPH